MSRFSAGNKQNVRTPVYLDASAVSTHTITSYVQGTLKLGRGAHPLILLDPIM